MASGPLVSGGGIRAPPPLLTPLLTGWWVLHAVSVCVLRVGLRARSVCGKARAALSGTMGKGPGHNNKGKRGHKLSHKSARRIKSALAPPDMMWEAFHAPQEIKARAVC